MAPRLTEPPFVFDDDCDVDYDYSQIQFDEDGIVGGRIDQNNINNDDDLNYEVEGLVSPHVPISVSSVVSEDHRSTEVGSGTETEQEPKDNHGNSNSEIIPGSLTEKDLANSTGSVELEKSLSIEKWIVVDEEHQPDQGQVKQKEQQQGSEESRHADIPVPVDTLSIPDIHSLDGLSAITITTAKKGHHGTRDDREEEEEDSKNIKVKTITITNGDIASQSQESKISGIKKNKDKEDDGKEESKLINRWRLKIVDVWHSTSAGRSLFCLLFSVMLLLFFVAVGTNTNKVPTPVISAPTILTSQAAVKVHKDYHHTATESAPFAKLSQDDPITTQDGIMAKNKKLKNNNYIKDEKHENESGTEEQDDDVLLFFDTGEDDNESTKNKNMLSTLFEFVVDNCYVRSKLSLQVDEKSGNFQPDFSFKLGPCAKESLDQMSNFFTSIYGFCFSSFNSSSSKKSDDNTAGGNENNRRGAGYDYFQNLFASRNSQEQAQTKSTDYFTDINNILWDQIQNGTMSLIQSIQNELQLDEQLKQQQFWNNITPFNDTTINNIIEAYQNSTSAEQLLDKIYSTMKTHFLDTNNTSESSNSTSYYSYLDTDVLVSNVFDQIQNGTMSFLQVIENEFKKHGGQQERQHSNTIKDLFDRLMDTTTSNNETNTIQNLFDTLSGKTIKGNETSTMKNLFNALFDNTTEANETNIIKNLFDTLYNKTTNGSEKNTIKNIFDIFHEKTKDSNETKKIDAISKFVRGFVQDTRKDMQHVTTAEKEEK